MLKQSFSLTLKRSIKIIYLGENCNPEKNVTGVNFEGCLPIQNCDDSNISYSLPTTDQTNQDKHDQLSPLEALEQKRLASRITMELQRRQSFEDIIINHEDRDKLHEIVEPIRRIR